MTLEQHLHDGKIAVVIPSDGEQMRFLALAIKSICMYGGQTVGTVMVVGERDPRPYIEPEVLDMLDVQYQAQTAPSRRYPIRNVQRALSEALESGSGSWLTNPFIWTHDDIFWRKALSWKYLYRRQFERAIGDLLEVKPDGLYNTASNATGEVLHELGYPHWDFELHEPIVMHMPEVQNMMEELDPNLQLRSMYLNMTGDTTPDIVDDTKLFHKPHYAESQLRAVSSSATFSVSTQYSPEDVKQLIMEGLEHGTKVS